jgi:hypothetical protein
MILSLLFNPEGASPGEQGLLGAGRRVGVVDVATYLPGWMENLPVARSAEVGAELSAATIAQVDLPGDA